MLEKNVGKIDRIARIIIGALLVFAAATGTVGAWGWVGVLPLATGLMSSCALYSVLGINTCKTK